jgi:P-type Cu2+ transporter
MIATYKVTGMTCQHCVKTLTRLLHDIKGIQSANVTLEPPQVTIRSSERISMEAINNELAEWCSYRLVEEEEKTT